MIVHWFKLYLKTVAKNRSFYLVNIMGLAIGVAAVTMVWLYGNNERSYNQWNPYKDRIYEVYEGEEYFKKGGFSPWLAAPYVNQLDKLTDVIEAYNFRRGDSKEISVRIGDTKAYLRERKDLQANVFQFFPFEMVYGSVEAYEKNWQDALALEVSEADRLFGKGADPVGRQLTLDGGKVLTVRCVYRIPGNSSIAPKALTAYETEEQIEKQRESNWSDSNFNLLIKLKEGVGLEEVKERIANVLYEHQYEVLARENEMSVAAYKKTVKENELFIFLVLDEVHLNPSSVTLGAGQNIQKTLYIMWGVALLILVLSVLNAINLSLLGSFERAKEVGVQKMLGATRATIVKQFMFEASVTAILALMLSMVLLEWLLPYFSLLVRSALTLSVGNFIPVFLCAFVFLLFFTGVLPAIFLSRFQALKVLKGNYLRRKSGSALRDSLLVFQFVIAFFFLTIAMLVHQQVNYMLEQDLGFSGDQVVNIRYRLKEGVDKYKHYQRFEEDLKKISGVKAVAVHAVLFGGGYLSSSTNVVEGEFLQSNNIPVSYDFMEVFQMQLKEGRFFDRAFASDSIDKVLVNETFEKMLGFQNGIVGEKIRWNNKAFEVIGVIRDFNSQGFFEENEASTYFMPNSVGWFSYLLDNVSVKIDAGDVQHTLERIERFWNERVDDEYGIRYSFANQDFERSYQRTMDQRMLFTVLMVVSVFIALIGLMALVSFNMESRLKEISIRKVLGASESGLLFDLCKRFVWYCALGFGISIYPVTYLSTVWLEDYVYRIEIGWEVFVLSFVILMPCSIVLVLWKAQRATRVNVLKYVNYE